MASSIRGTTMCKEKYLRNVVSFKETASDSVAKKTAKLRKAAQAAILEETLRPNAKF